MFFLLRFIPLYGFFLTGTSLFKPSDSLPRFPKDFVLCLLHQHLQIRVLGRSIVNNRIDSVDFFRKTIPYRKL